MKWIKTTIGDYCPFSYGKSLPKRDRKKGSIPVYGSNGVVGYHYEPSIKTMGIIIGRKGSIGQIHLSKSAFWAIDTAFFIVKDSIEELYFTYYLLKSVGLHNLNSDSAVPGLNRNNAHACEILIPANPKDRKKIGAWIATIDNAIELNKTINQTLEEIVQAIFKSWFIDFEPVKAKMEVLESGGSPEEAEIAAMCKISGKNEVELEEFKKNKPDEFAELAHTASLFPSEMQESELSKIPTGWNCTPFGQFVSAKRGKSITKAKIKNGEVPVIAGGIKPAYYHSEFNVLPPVITISASGANAGYINLYQKHIWASDCSYISLEQTPYVFFCYSFLKFNQKKIFDMQQGAAQPHIYPSDIARLDLKLPSNRLLQLFENLVNPIYQKIKHNNSQNKTLEEIKERTLPKLLSGEVVLNTQGEPQ